MRSTARVRRIGLLSLCFVAVGLACADRPDLDPASIEIRNARHPAPGLLGGGQPTREQLEQAAEAGYKTVVNLRALSETGAWDETEFVTQLGMRFVHIPVAGKQALNRDNAALLREVLQDDDAKPVLVHCAGGPRVGALLAVAASLDGKTVDEALEFGRSAGIGGLETVMREYLSRDH